MTDDYQYREQSLPPKNEGLFGYGGKPNEGSRGFQGDIVDYGGTGGAIGGGVGPQGPQGPEGDPGLIVDGVLGDMLYHDGTDWVTFPKPATDGILTIVEGIPEWITASDKSLIYFNDDEGNWNTLPAPENTGTFVLGFVDGVLEWMQTIDCGATGATGP